MEEQTPKDNSVVESDNSSKEETTLQDNVAVESDKSPEKEAASDQKSDEGKEKKALYAVIGILFVLFLFTMFLALRLYTQNQDLNEEVDTLDVQVTQLEAKVNNPVVADPLPIDDTRPADGVTPDEDQSDEYDVMYEYAYDGQEHTLVMDNPEGLSYKVETQDVYGPVMVVRLDEKTTLEVRLNDEGGEAGIYGDFIAEVKGDIIRNRYFGDHYVLRAEEGACEFGSTEENPCVYTLFHNDSDGMLSAYVRFEDQDQPEDNLPSDAALALADAMIVSYRIE